MRKTLILCLFTVGLAALVGSRRQTAWSEHAATCAMPAENQIATALSTWERTFASGDPEALTALYPSQAVLMGTDETSIAIGTVEIVQHYTALLRLHPTVQTTSHSIQTTCGLGIVHGTQTIGTAERQLMVGFRMVFMSLNGQLQLLHHRLEHVPPNPALLRAEFEGSENARDAAEPLVGAGRHAARSAGSGTSPSLTTGAVKSAHTVREAGKSGQTEGQPPPFELSPRSLSRTSLLARPLLPQSDTQHTIARGPLVPPLELSIGPFPLVARIDVVVPVLSLDLGPFPAIDTPAVVVPRLALDIGLFPEITPPARPVSIDIPRLALDIGRFPDLDVRPAESNQPAVDPARVAGFSQRATAAAPPDVVSAAPPAKATLTAKAKSAPRPKQNAATAPASTSGSTAYRTAKRWVDQMPVFED